MALTRLTSEGQVTLPSEIRELLNLHPGDLIDFVIAEDGKVYLQPTKIDVRELSGMLYESGRKAVSLEEMNAAIAQCAGESA